jgi:hypothetical protein
MQSARAFDLLSGGSLVIASLLLASCGSECTGEGCSSSIALTATVERDTAPWSVEFCRAGDCSTCPLGDPGETSASCSDVVVSLSSEPDAGPARLVVSTSKPPFNDGEALTLRVTSASGQALIDWKGIARYMQITTGGPRCDTPGHCSLFRQSIP